MVKFKNKYRIESNRLKGWDYGSNAMYFITICCKNRECFFGDVNAGKMKMSAMGHIVNSCWVEIANHFPFVILHHHIIMPNHVHGIIEIAKSDNEFHENDGLVDDGLVVVDTVETPNLGVSTTGVSTTTSNLGVFMPDLGVSASNATPNDIRTHNASKKWKPNTIGSIINQYKRACTINARKINPNFAWQPNYHDHIIRNEKSYQTLSNYIINNPIKWTEDTFNPESVVQTTKLGVSNPKNPNSHK